MREKDERVRVITEILGGIKVLKLYAWEGSFTDKIDALRDKEIRYLKIMQVSKLSSLFDSFVFLSERLHMLDSSISFNSVAFLTVGKVS